MNRMQLINFWTSDRPQEIQAGLQPAAPDSATGRVAVAAVACSNARLEGPSGEEETGDPTELALLHLAASQGVRAVNLDVERLSQFHFDPVLRRTGHRLGMSCTPKARRKKSSPCAPTSLQPAQAVY